MDAPEVEALTIWADPFVRPTIMFLNEILQNYFLECAWSDEF